MGTRARSAVTSKPSGGTNKVTKLLPPDVNPQPFIPFPDFGHNASYASTNANSYYHSLQSKYIRRMARVLDMLVAYTWGKTRTDAGDRLSGGAVGGFRAASISGFGIDKDYGLASFDVRQAFTLSGTYELPVGRGRRWRRRRSGNGSPGSAQRECRYNQGDRARGSANEAQPVLSNV